MKNIHAKRFVSPGHKTSEGHFVQLWGKIQITVKTQSDYLQPASHAFSLYRQFTA